MAERIEKSLQSGILRLALNEPTSRNALSEAMMADLQSSFDDAEKNQDVRVIILAANGPVFCAGHNLKEMTNARQGEDAGKTYFTKVLRQCSFLMQSIVNHPKPVIAEVGGIATAAGCQLVASCDLAIANENAKFATPGVHIGLFCSTPMVALSRNVSNKHAMEMLLLGAPISAEKAAEIGLVNKVVAKENLVDEALNWAKIIASKSMMTLKTGKQAYYQQRQMKLEEAYEYASQIMVENMLKHDAQEGISAFIEKREPNWQDS